MEANPWIVIRKYAYELIIVSAGFLVFFNSLFNGFVWDDVQYIVNYPLVHSFNLGLLLGPNIYNGGFFYRPVSAFYFAAIFTLFNGTPFFFHAIQLGVHVANTLLLLRLFENFFKKNIAFFLTLIFLIHPITTESVAYISTIDDPLFVCFGLVSILFVLKKDLSLWINKVLLICCLLLVLLTKETGAIFLLLCVLMSYLYKKKAFLFTIV
ncbi:MAG: hypothetical protein KGJ07_03250, partial [Patescibacteria group bacterium]|nr:hypothetical protein [Patescibacteria group bacterium]